MKLAQFLITVSMSISAFAADPTQHAIWLCHHDNNPLAVYLGTNLTAGENPYYLAINDPAITRVLGLPDYFSAPAKWTSNGPSGKMGYLALNGEGTQGVFFGQDSGGFKLILAESIEGIHFYQDRNYFLNPGECTPHEPLN